MYYRWMGEIPKTIRLLPVQLPGREQRFKEPPLTDMTSMIEALGPALPPHCDGPFALLGQSMGSLIAFELARWLRRNRQTCPLFDTPRFTRNLESAYHKMMRRWRSGQMPEPFIVGDIDPDQG